MNRDNTHAAILSKRKSEHLQIVTNEDVVHSGGTLLNDIRLYHQALPELSINELYTQVEFFGKILQVPFMITGMTGGADFAGQLNRGLAEVAEKHGIAMGVGSQRIMIRHPEMAKDFQVRDKIPNGVLLGNIGAVQLQEYTPDVIKALVDIIEADGICVHLNAAQEIMQEEGHRNFNKLLDKIDKLNSYLDGKVLVKETGAGMSIETLKQLKSIGITIIDVAGAGGTSWTKVEALRAQNQNLKKLGMAFADWGVPTAFSIISAKKIMGDGVKLIGSGGITSGLDAARAIAAGADIAGFARPALLAYMSNGSEGVSSLINSFTEELKAAMLLTGSKDITALKKASRAYKSELKDLLENHGWFEGEQLGN